MGAEAAAPLSTRKKKGKPSLAEMLAEDARLPAAQAQRKSGKRNLLALFDAWVSALIFDGKGAYEAERDVATIGRTTLNVIIAVVVATFLLAIGLFMGLTRILTAWGEALPLGIGGLVQGGTNYAGTMSVLTTPFLVITFFAIAFAMQKAAGLFGSTLDFFESAHLFSISFSPTVILLAFLLTVNFLLAAFMLGSIDMNSSTWSAAELAALERYNQLSPVFGGCLGSGFSTR
ncbi:MAG: hypothetical protein M5R40_29330 [Anaerolineae bacterium]|nr:hypothetical protein [Anaerolineae bacterium]